MGDLSEAWSEVTGTAGAEAAARSYERMAKTWIPADLGETWGEVARAASTAEASARAYQQARNDPAHSDADRLRARSEYKEATKRLHLALRTARAQEGDELWGEVIDAAQRAQAAGHTFFVVKHDPSRPKSERTNAREAYAQAKSRVASLMVELEIMPRAQADGSAYSAEELDSAETPELASEPSDAEQEPEPTSTENSEWAQEISEPGPEEQSQEQKPEESNPPSWD